MAIDLAPPENLIQLVGGRDATDYWAVGQEFFDIFVRYGGLKASDRVLDVGCGCGRMALPLTGYLTTGSYEGFDISADAIEWCQKNITAQFPNFKFQLANLANSVYNRQGKHKARNYKFPYPDRSFDFTFLTSVFTHMLPREMEHYAREIARTLKPNGRAAITFFIWNEESERLTKTRPGELTFQHSYGQVRVQQRSKPEAAIAYPEATVRRVLEESGLTLVEPIYFGSWCGRSGTVTFQDLTLSERQAGPRLQSETRSILGWLKSRFSATRPEL